MKDRFRIKLLISLVICLGGGWLTGLLTQSGVKDWYPTLAKSPLTPPDYVFPLAWTCLYILMGISLALIWERGKADKLGAFAIFGLQLFLNFIWSWIFFYLQLPGAALLDIALLWIAILATIFIFLKHSAVASALLLPYLAWVSFAFYLNLFIWWNN